MVKHRSSALDRTFAALSDPTRRAMLARLGGTDSLTVTALAEPFAISLPAVMKHLDVLTDAGLVARSKCGRSVNCRLTAAPLEDAMMWLIRYQRFWTQRLDRLAAYVEEESCPPPVQVPPQGQASRSNVVSMRRRKRSMRRGPNRTG